MPKKDRISDEDKALFRESVTGVRRIKSDKAETEKPKPKAKKFKHPRKQSQTQKRVQEKTDQLDDLSTMYRDPSSRITAEQILRYALVGVDQRTQAKLKKAGFPISGTLDLHGMTVQQARRALVEFIDTHGCEYRRCVCIIHGKSTRTGGDPILKSNVNHWLRQMPEVVAFHSAPARFGGNGALLILIKSRE